MRREFYLWPDETRTGEPKPCHVEIDAPQEVHTPGSRFVTWNCTAHVDGLWSMDTDIRGSGTDAIQAFMSALAGTDAAIRGSTYLDGRLSLWKDEYDPEIFPELAKPTLPSP